MAATGLLDRVRLVDGDRPGWVLHDIGAGALRHLVTSGRSRVPHRGIDVDHNGPATEPPPDVVAHRTAGLPPWQVSS